MKRQLCASQWIEANWVSESNDGEFSSFRLGGQLEMVHAHEYHLVLEQSRSLPTKTRSIAS